MKNSCGPGTISAMDKSGILKSVRSASLLAAILTAATLTPLLTASPLHPVRRPREELSPSVANLPGPKTAEEQQPQIQRGAVAQASTLPTEPTTPAPVPAPTTVVVLDPAHGGSDTGARGASGVVESDIVLDFARAIQTTLQAQGLRVLLTREGNQDPSFDDRSALVNGLSGAVFISLHVSSTGPIGTARVYWYSPQATAEQAPEPEKGTTASTAAPAAAPAARNPVLAASVEAPIAHPGLVEWEEAQSPYATWSRRLAELVQIQLAQKFPGSPEIPQGVPVRQLRSIAAPAIAVEVSSVAVSDPQQLEQMSQPLADALTRGVNDFRQMLSNAGVSPGGNH